MESMGAEETQPASRISPRTLTCHIQTDCHQIHKYIFQRLRLITHHLDPGKCGDSGVFVVGQQVKTSPFLPGVQEFDFLLGGLRRAQLSAENRTPVQAGACLDDLSLHLLCDSLGNHDVLDGLPSVTGSWLSGPIPYSSASEFRQSLGVYSHPSRQKLCSMLGRE